MTSHLSFFIPTSISAIILLTSSVLGSSAVKIIISQYSEEISPKKGLFNTSLSPALPKTWIKLPFTVGLTAFNICSDAFEV